MDVIEEAKARTDHMVSVINVKYILLLFLIKKDISFKFIIFLDIRKEKKTQKRRKIRT